MSWLPMVMPRRLARSTSVKSPSGLRQSVSLSASLANSSGRCSRPAGPAGLRPWRGSRGRRNRAADARSHGSPRHGRRRARRCVAPRRSRVARGAKGSPFSARRSPRSAASWMRRDASARVIRNRLANAGASLPPNSVGSACSASWLISACSTAGSQRRIYSHRSNTPSRSGVVSTSKVRSRARL